MIDPDIDTTYIPEEPELDKTMVLQREQEVTKGYEAIVRLFLDSGVDANVRGDHLGGESLLHLAVQAGDEGIVRLLLERGAHVDVHANNGETPLYLAYIGRHDGIGRLLLDKGADANAIGDHRGGGESLLLLDHASFTAGPLAQPGPVAMWPKHTFTPAEKASPPLPSGHAHGHLSHHSTASNARNSSGTGTGTALWGSGFPPQNAAGQRICRQCGLPGQYKDGKCVERWRPGPEGPGTVCDACDA